MSMSPSLSSFEQMTFEDGKNYRDRGIQKAIDHANENSLAWSHRAFIMLERFLMINGPTFEFMGENIRIYAEQNGLEKPPTNNAWGGIIRKAAHQNLIECVGFREAKTVSSHASARRVWKRKSK